MNKQEMISQLNDRIAYNADQRAYYEKLRDENPDDHSIWSEMVDWYKGKIAAFNIAIEMAEELDQ